MYSLTKPIEDIILYGRKKFILHLAFDNVLRVYELWKDELFSNQEKLEMSLEILIQNHKLLRKLTVEEKSELLQQIFENFISLNSKSTGEDIKAFDFQQDANYIFASFLMDYNIDLIEQQGVLHWWKFISLFQGLSERTKIHEIMTIRTRKIPELNKYNAEEINALTKLKAYYALEMSQEEQEVQFEMGLEKLARALEKRAVNTTNG